jgi:GT2 family glycosyltransferase
LAQDGHITVGVPVYQGWATVGNTLRAIQNQSYRDYDVVISVDGGDERSADACRPFLSDSRFRLTVQPQQLGMFGNTNWVAAQTRGEFFYYQQQDDFVAASFFERLVAAGTEHPDAASLYADVQWAGARTEMVREPSITGEPMARVIAQISALHWVPYLGLIRREALRAAGPLTANDDAYAEDVVWITKLLRHGECRRIPAVLYFKGAHSDSAHAKYFKWERARRRTAWVDFCWRLLAAALPVTKSDVDRDYLLKTMLTRLVPGPRGFALYQPFTREERDSLVGEFFALAESRGLLRRVSASASGSGNPVPS